MKLSIKIISIQMQKTESKVCTSVEDLIGFGIGFQIDNQFLIDLASISEYQKVEMLKIRYDEGTIMIKNLEYSSNTTTCPKCKNEVPLDEVEERYSFGVYAGTFCVECCSSYRDNCGIDGFMGTQQEYEEYGEVY